MLSKRLKAIANCVPPYRFVVDVGTDHCFVPIYLMLHGQLEHAIGTDVRMGPVEEAKKNIEAYGFQNQIEIRMGDGLSTLSTKDHCDCIVIAGMGGKLIAEILDAGKPTLGFNKRLVLQPNIDEDCVRKWLCENHYEIVKELILEDEAIFYEIIVAEKRSQIIELTDLEIKYGPYLMKEKSDVFIKKYQYILNVKKQVYPKIPDYHENKKRIKNEIDELDMILKN